MQRLLPILLVTVFFAVRAAAQTRALSLREALQLALRQNPELAASGSVVSISEAGVLEVRGLDDPVLEASASWRSTRLDAVPGVLGEQRAFDEALGVLSLTKPLGTGGRVGLQLESGYGRVRFDADAGNAPGERWIAAGTAPSVQVYLEQPLLRGFGADVARADRRRANIRRDLARAEREALAAALLRQVTSNYWELVYAGEELAIRRASAGAARDQLLRVQANIGVGKLPRSATAEIEVAIALRNESVLAAEQAVTDQSLALRLQCGMPIDETLVASDPLPDGVALAATALTTQQALETALTQNAQLQAVRQQERSSLVEVEVTENGLLPQLDFVLAGGRSGDASDPSVPDRWAPGFAGYTATAGLAFALPMGRDAARGARDAVRERLRKARLDAAAIAAQVRAGVLRAVSQRETARRRVEALEPSVRAAALDLEAEKARFEVGRATNFDVLRRQDQLAQVLLLSLRARVDQLNAIVALEAVTGEILERSAAALRGDDR